MWTSTLELSPKRVILTQLLGRFFFRAFTSTESASTTITRSTLGARTQSPGGRLW